MNLKTLNLTKTLTLILLIYPLKGQIIVLDKGLNQAGTNVACAGIAGTNKIVHVTSGSTNKAIKDINYGDNLTVDYTIPPDTAVNDPTCVIDMGSNNFLVGFAEGMVALYNVGTPGYIDSL